MSKIHTFFVVSSPGLESWTEKELRPLISRPQTIRRLAGGVEFSGSMEDCWRTNVWLRTATRILRRMGSFYSAGFPELTRKASRLDWARFITRGQSITLHVTAKKSKLYHTDAISERLHIAIGEVLGHIPQIKDDADSQQIFARMNRDLCEISLDTSGMPLYQRGYRLAAAKAPIRENLAAAILMASAWDRISPLLDPFCGSGTFAIESALMAQNLAPGRNRKFAFMNWPDFNSSQCKKSVKDDEGQTRTNPHILASDRDSGAIKTAMENAERAGVSGSIHFTKQAISHLNPHSDTGWIVTNPPFGKRVTSGKDLRNLYARFGHILRERFQGWHVTLLSHNRHLLKATRIQFDESLFIDHGGLKTTVARGQVPGH